MAERGWGLRAERSDSDRLKLMHDIFELAFNSTCSFEDVPELGVEQIGVTLAYIASAIADPGGNGFVEHPKDSATMVWLKVVYPRGHGVWDYIQAVDNDWNVVQAWVETANGWE